MNLPPSLSEVNCFMQCQQQWHWRYIRKIQRPMRPEPMERGSLIHLGLATYYSMKPHDFITAAQAMYTVGNKDWKRYEELAEPDEDEAKKFQIMLASCERMLKLYDGCYAGEELNIVAVEKEFILPLHRIVDMITRGENDLVWAWEHKTSSRMPELSNLTATMEPALTCLACGAEGIIYNIITTDPIKFGRQDFTISQEQKDYAHSWYRTIHSRINESYDICLQFEDARDWFTPVHNRNCNWCEFGKLCNLMSSGRGSELDGIIARLYIPKTERMVEAEND